MENSLLNTSYSLIWIVFFFRKAVRAALVLLPLLGITNILNLIEAPLDSGVWMFGLWSYSTHFLRSFQGFFIALIYCFLNGEVSKKWLCNKKR